MTNYDNDPLVNIQLVIKNMFVCCENNLNFTVINCITNIFIYQVYTSGYTII